MPSHSLYIRLYKMAACIHLFRFLIQSQMLHEHCSNTLLSLQATTKIAGDSWLRHIQRCVRGCTVSNKGDPRITIRNAPPGQPPRTSSSLQCSTVELLGTGPSRGGPSISFGTPDEQKMSFTASEEGLSSSDAEDFAEQPPATASHSSEVELTAVLLQAIKSIGLEVSSLKYGRRATVLGDVSLLTTLDGGGAKRYVDFPQVERAVVPAICCQLTL